MGILDKLFGRKEQGYKDERGIYFNIVCGKCGNELRVRADRQYDLNRTDSGFVWRKTIVCDRCFTQMPAQVTFDGKYNIVSSDIEKGEFRQSADA